ncbi:MAG: stage II sporulation protein M [Ruminococcus sp.]
MKHRKDLTQTESRRICLFMLNIAVLAGVAVGAVIAVTGKGTSNPLLHQFFSPAYSGDTVLEVFRNTFLTSAFFMAALFLLGFFAFGQPLGVAMLIYRGVGIGTAVAQMYIAAGLASLPSVLVLVLPKALVTAFTASLGARELLRLSRTVLLFLFKDEQPNEKMSRTIKLYCIKFIVLIFLLLLAALADSALNYIFMDLRAVA